MASINKVMIMGRITREIELRKTPKNKSVADIGLAVNRRRKDESGQMIDETTFVDVTLWGRTAEVVHQYSGKGQPIFVEGRLETDTWEDKDTGQKRYKLKIVGENVQLMGSKAENEASKKTNGSPDPQEKPRVSNLGDEDIPF